MSKKMSDNNLGKVSGGRIEKYYNDEGNPLYRVARDDDGILTFGTIHEAREYAHSKDIDDTVENFGDMLGEHFANNKNSNNNYGHYLKTKD